MRGALQIFLSIVIAGLFLYFFIERQNTLTEVRLAIPKLAKEVHEIRKQNEALRYEIERFEGPDHLMKLLKEPAYSHLKYPESTEVIIIEEDDDATAF